MRLLVVHGPNLNLLGTREPDVYGPVTLTQIDAALSAAAAEHGHTIESFQSNHEGALIDRLQQADGEVAGALVNPGGYTHTSVALRDAIAAVSYPVVEVHLSNVFAREDFRQTSLISGVCAGIVCGFGPHSYGAALTALLMMLEDLRDA